jgi:hypothetical protein
MDKVRERGINLNARRIRLQREVLQNCKDLDLVVEFNEFPGAVCLHW